MKKKIADWLHRLANKIGGPPFAGEGRVGGARFTLVDSTPAVSAKPRMVDITVCQSGGCVEIHAEGYGPVVNDVTQELMTIEVWDGRLRLLYWGRQDPERTHSNIIDLEDARNSARTRVSARD